MLKRSYISFLILLFYLGCCFFLYQNQRGNFNKSTVSSNVASSPPIQIEEKKAIATLEIPDIGLQQDIYNLDDPRNNVEENVTMLSNTILPKMDSDSDSMQGNSIIFLAAHSGTGEKALFTRLDELKIGNLIFFLFDNQEFTYQIDVIEEQEKNGTITVPRNETDELILTTCSEQNKTKQLVIISKLIKKEK